MHTAISLSRPLPPLLPVRSRHPLDLDPLDFRRRIPATPKVLSRVGDPPVPLADVHRPAVLNGVLGSVLAHLREPVRVQRGETTSFPVLRGLLSFHRQDHDGIAVVLHQRRTGSTIKRVEVDATTFDLERMLPLQVAMDALRRDLYDAVFRADCAHPRKIEGYVEWAHRALLGALARDELWREPGYDFHEELGFEPLWVAIARNIPPEPGKPAASLAAYNHVAKHAEEYEQLLCDNENLIPLYGLLRDEPDFPTGVEPIAALRAFLLARGLSPALWRRLAQAGRNASVPVRAPDPRQSRAESVLVALGIVDRLGPQHDPPRWLVESVARRARPDDVERFDERARPWLAVARRMAVLHRQAEPDTREAMQEMVELAFRWADGTPDLAARTLALMDWPSIARRARLHRERVEAADVTFPVPFDRMEIDGYEVTALSSALALKDEGIEMRHCAGTYTVVCKDGRKLLCSIRKRDDPRGRWTVAIARGERWKLELIAGWVNRTATPEARSVAARLVAWLNRFTPTD